MWVRLPPSAPAIKTSTYKNGGGPDFRASAACFVLLLSCFKVQKEAALPLRLPNRDHLPGLCWTRVELGQLLDAFGQ